MKTRVIVGAALIAMLIAMLALGDIAYLAVLTLFGFAAIYELATVFRKKGYRPIVLPAYAFAILFPALYQLVGLIGVVVPYFLALLITLSCSVFSEKRSAGDALISMSLFVYPLALLLCTLLLYFTVPFDVSLTAACMALAAPEFCDMLAYFGGTLFGKRKLCPSISPKKTVEGSVCATVGGVLFGAIIFFAQRIWGGDVPLYLLLPLGLGCGLLSQLGDLFASKIKRWADVKDFSSIFPGHGGVMDRIDSILFCAPLVYSVFALCIEFGVLKGFGA